MPTSTSPTPFKLGIRRRPRQDLKTLPPLPYDLIVYIYQYIPNTQIYPSVLACKSFQSAVEPLLYRHIDLSNCPIRSTYFLRTAFSRPGLLKHIRSYQIAEQYPQPPWLLSRLAHHIHGCQLADYRKTYIVRRLDAVEKLGMTPKAMVHGWYKSEDRPQGLPAFKALKSFKLLPTWSAINYDALLSAMPLVTRLDFSATEDTSIINHMWGINIRPHHVPLLEEIICDSDVAEKLVPGRPVRTLLMLLETNPNGSAVATLSKVAKSSANITLLGVKIEDWNMPGLGDVVATIGRLFPYVEELRLCLTVGWDFYFPTMRPILDQMAAHLAEFPYLRVLDFTGSSCRGCKVSWFSHNMRGPPWIYTPVLRSWSQGCSTLTRVVLPNGCVWRRANGDFKWRCDTNWPILAGNTRSRTGVGGLAHPENPEARFRNDLPKAWPDSWTGIPEEAAA